MAKPSLHTPILHRDGTSQAARSPAALDPDHVAIDERTPADLLAFARSYAEELVYYDHADRPAGDWSAFLDDDALLEMVNPLAGSLARPPARSLSGTPRSGARPHTALLLAFIELLGHAQREMNGLTRRHLDFYYRIVLGMTTRPATPDRVHVLFEPSTRAERASVHIPAGTLLDAGKDHRGKTRSYRSDRDVFVNRAQVAELRSLYVERETTTLRDVRRDHQGLSDQPLLAMLRVALGQPQPGDPPPAFKGVQPVDATLLRALRDVIGFARDHLFMELHELRALMQLKQRRDHADDQWDAINDRLQDAARARLGDPNHIFRPADPRDFDRNLLDAIGSEPNFVGMAEVSSIDDLYRERTRQDVKAFIRTQLHFTDSAEFTRMMQIKLRIDSEWREINRLLQRAGRTKRDDQTYLLAPADLTTFESNLEAAVGPVDYAGLAIAGVSNLDTYSRELDAIESYFHLPAEDVEYLIAVHHDRDASERAWNKVHDLLAEAHAARMYADRRAALQRARASVSSEERKLRTTFEIALGQETGPADALQLIPAMDALVAGKTDRQFLLDAVHRVVMASATLDDREWDRIDHIAELAQRTRERLATPVAEMSRWLDIHPHDDATQVTTTLGLEADSEILRWKTFGAAETHGEKASPPAATIGWGVRSPLLSLREGQRTIVATLGFSSAGFDPDSITGALTRNPFFFELTSAKGWIPVGSPTIVQGAYRALSGLEDASTDTGSGDAPDEPDDAALRALQITLTLADDAEPVTAPDAPDTGAVIRSAPALRLMLRPIWDAERERYVTLYAPFQDLQLQAVHLRVEVNGLTALALENDDNALDASKPFTPFGNRPAVGSRFFVGHPELVQKRLDSVRFHLDWMRVASDLATHYQNYDIDPDFKVRIALHDRRRTLPLADQSSLFAPDDAATRHTIELGDISKTLRDPAYQRAPEIARGDKPGDVSRWSRHLIWELTPTDFQHDVYPQVAASKAHEMAAAIAAQVASGSSTPVDVQAYRVNPPYTPTLKRLAVDYTSSSELHITAEADTETASPAGPRSGRAIEPRTAPQHGDDVAYHIHPFGTSDLRPEPGGAPLLPRYDRHEGALYIGLRDVAPPQNLSLLIQMAEGSADPDLPPGAIEWSYLSDDRWVSLHDGSILADGTRGLLQSGILELSLSPAAPSTLLPAGLYWLRAAIPQHTASVCDTMAIHAQAMSASFVGHDSAPDHHDAPLPAGTITRLLSPMTGIAAVHQPYTGFGGARPERAPEFYARVSERLRHKERALTVWDHEHLVLQRFPQIYKAKCLPARAHGSALDPSARSAVQDSASTPDAPGQVTVIVIPDIRNQIPFDPFAPKAPASTISEIASYLGDKLPASATVEVRNAFYIPIKVRVSVRFHPGHDEGFARKTLEDEINRFLSPWAYDDAIDITIGDRIYANSIIDFIDRRPYVDYVVGITLLRCDDGEHFTRVEPSESEGYYVAAERPDGVLVAARNHEITVGAHTEIQRRTATGVNHMTVGLDFIVSGAGVAGLERTGIDFMEVGDTFVISDEEYKKREGVGRMTIAETFRID